MCAILGICLATFIFGLQNVDGYANGPPWKTCLTMFPKHEDRQNQEKPCPFQMTANTSRYSPSDTLKLTVSSKMTYHTFVGIQIRARPKYGDSERVVGHFIEWPTNKTQAFSCFGGENNMIGHANNIPVASLELLWTAPSESVGDIELVVSYVKDFHTFWTNEIVELSAIVSIQATPVEQMSPTFEVIDWSHCGKSKGCFLYPRTCSGRDCYAAVTYKTVNDSIEFEMFCSQEGYVSVGYSDDKHMGDEETITCTGGELGSDIQRGYNHLGLYNERQLKEGLFEMQGTYKDGRLYCRFKRPMTMSVFITKGHTAKKQFDFSLEYYLMLAWGPIMKGTDVITIHKELPPITDQKVNFRENVFVRGSSLPITKQIHGSLMLIGWMWLICIATILARHYKDGFKNNTICGSKVWFQMHRILAIMTWLFTAASFILIFVVVRQLTEHAKVHSYLGITVMSASTLQLVMGFLRPTPESKSRKIFNWGHLFLGKATVVLAAVTLFFAFNNDMIPKPQTYFANIVLGVYVGQQMLWELWFEINGRQKRKNQLEVSQIHEKTENTYKSKSDKMPTDEYQASKASNTALMLYIICITTTFAAALATVFIY